MLNFFLKIIVRLLLIGVSLQVYAANRVSSSVRFLVLSDIHFDPYLICKKQAKKPCLLLQQLQAAPAANWGAILKKEDKSVARYYQDTSYSLLATSLAFASDVANKQHVQFVLVLGDFLAHQYLSQYKKYALHPSPANYQVFAKKTMTFLMSELHKAFPNVSIYSVVGNNDSYQGNYYTKTNGAFFADLSVMWGELLKEPKQRQALQATFARAGYYSLDLNKELCLIGLNTVLFSSDARGRGVAQAATQQLKWLHQQLQIVKQKHQRVLIIMHIPEAKDIHLMPRIRLFRLLDLWHTQYIDSFQAEISQFAPQIAGIYNGHLHADGMEIQSVNGEELEKVSIPSISPVYGSDPGFTFVEYSMPNYEFLDATTYDFSF